MPDWISKYWLEWAFGILASGLIAGYTRLSKRIREYRDEQEAVRNGMRALLMRQIAADCEDAKREGWCPLEKKKMINDMYRCYHALGGNDVITAMINDLMRLSTEEPVKGGKD